MKCEPKYEFFYEEIAPINIVCTISAILLKAKCFEMKLEDGGWTTICHDDIIKWTHFPRYWPYVRGIHRSPVNSPHKGQWRGALMFSFICAWINCWINNRNTGDLRSRPAHYDVIIMSQKKHSCKMNEELAHKKPRQYIRQLCWQWGNFSLSWP